MEIILIRTYYPDGTNGILQVKDDPVIICNTIELPWKDNQRNISCIPEGRYGIKMRFTKKRLWHMVVTGVKKRSLILIHTANIAVLELEGCIAPVTIITGQGRGSRSRQAKQVLRFLRHLRE